MKNGIRLAVSLALSVLFLWIAFRGVDFKTMMQHLGEVKLGYVMLYVLMLIVIQFARAFRWDILIRPFAKVDLAATLRISNLGNMLIMLLPLRLGEFARPYLLKRESGAPLSAGVGAVVVERVIDGLLVTLLFFVTTHELGPPYQVPPLLQTGALLALALFSGATLVIVVTLITHGWLPKFLRRIGEPIAPTLTDKLIGMLDAFVSGLRSLPDARALGAVVFWTLLYWAANAMGLYWLMIGFGWALPLSAGFTVVCVLVIGIMIPAGPGFLGTYQAALVTGLSVYNIGKTEALAYSLLAYPLNLAVVVGFGLPYLFGRNQVKVGDLVKAQGDSIARDTVEVSPPQHLDNEVTEPQDPPAK